MEEKTFMTQEGYDKTVERLNYLKSTRRQEVANKIAEIMGVESGAFENCLNVVYRKAKRIIADETNQNIINNLNNLNN